MSEFKTPGVYVKENNASGNSVVEVPTAVPCFIGLTGKTVAGTASIIGKPVRISSMSDYTQYFGGPPLTPFTLEETDANGTDTDTELYVWDDGAKKGLKATYGALYTLYYQMVMFFANGGGTCYVASMGDYGDYDKTFADHYTDEAKEKLFDNIEKEAEITIIVVPEAVNCEGWARIYTDILTRLCSTGRLFTILDVPDAGDANHKGPVETFRDAVGNEGLQFAAAYYPWLQSSVLSENNLEDMMVWKDGYKTVPASLDGSLKEFVAAAFAKISKNTDSRGSAMDMLLSGEAVMKEKSTLHRAMLQSWPLYRSMAFKIRQRLNLLPPPKTAWVCVSTADLPRIYAWSFLLSA